MGAGAPEAARKSRLAPMPPPAKLFTPRLCSRHHPPCARLAANGSALTAPAAEAGAWPARNARLCPPARLPTCSSRPVLSPAAAGTGRPWRLRPLPLQRARRSLRPAALGLTMAAPSRVPSPPSPLGRALPSSRPVLLAQLMAAGPAPRRLLAAYGQAQASLAACGGRRHQAQGHPTIDHPTRSHAIS
jgi:hypothetical protein